MSTPWEIPIGSNVVPLGSLFKISRLIDSRKNRVILNIVLKLRDTNSSGKCSALQRSVRYIA